MRRTSSFYILSSEQPRRAPQRKISPASLAREYAHVVMRAQSRGASRQRVARFAGTQRASPPVAPLRRAATSRPRRQSPARGFERMSSRCARTWPWVKTRHWVGQCSVVVSLSRLLLEYPSVKRSKAGEQTVGGHSGLIPKAVTLKMPYSEQRARLAASP